jgi:hypothetical protein
VVANLGYVSSAHPSTMWADAWKNGPDIEQNLCDEILHFWRAVVKSGLNSSKLRLEQAMLKVPEHVRNVWNERWEQREE